MKTSGFYGTTNHLVYIQDYAYPTEFGLQLLCDIKSRTLEKVLNEIKQEQNHKELYDTKLFNQWTYIIQKDQFHIQSTRPLTDLPISWIREQECETLEDLMYFIEIFEPLLYPSGKPTNSNIIPPPKEPTLNQQEPSIKVLSLSVPDEPDDMNLLLVEIARRKRVKINSKFENLIISFEMWKEYRVSGLLYQFLDDKTYELIHALENSQMKYYRKNNQHILAMED